jgi:excisionase family DNA binding protein
VADDHPIPFVEPLLTYDKAGKLMGVTERTIRTLVKQGEMTL